MTSFEIEELSFSLSEVERLASRDARLKNWPVVYMLHNTGEVYVGESLNGLARLRQHLKSPDKQGLAATHVVLGEQFNKSVCLDLESFLIRLFAGDGKFQVLNRNDGITDADYYLRADYQQTFEEIFEQLRAKGAFTRPVREIENTDLFKLSPFKALTQDQAVAIEDILDGLFEDLDQGVSSRVVVQGDPGTGKTVVGIFLVKLLRDIATRRSDESADGESVLSEYFVEGHRKLLDGFRIGLVVPQQSLRKSIENVFRKTPGLDASMVLTPFQVGQAAEPYDLLVVDEAHRLNQRSSQASGPMNAQFKAINEKLFGRDDLERTQLDWINDRSKHQVYLLDAAQSVRPHDVSRADLDRIVDSANERHRRYPLSSQMRVKGGNDYVGYVRAVLSDAPPHPQRFNGYDLRMYDDLGPMFDAIRELDSRHGLARLVAGYAWPWRSKRDRSAYDIDLDGLRLRWNQVAVDWVNSPGSLDEVGSIHTIQGYDLNYAGVIIGKDLRYDADARSVWFDRTNYFDSRGMQNNRIRGITYSDDDVLQMVRNIYAVLLTRGIRGTFVYVCDDALRDHLRPYFGSL
ncbi:DNA/RNA helicase domain-containing protein [Nocardioides aurantiacus]|uniref:DNA/RNA helicase domain-containing protein n=1 Tax=Nocardioides aurantiacus TaxID=86796 RepID=UPI00403F3D90